MNRKLDILVPHYKEDFSVLKPLLDSIMIQQNVNFDDVGVIITNDGDDVIFDEKLFESYPFKIEYHIKKHEGVSAARNYCLDCSKAQYVMYCDIDDMMATVFGLWIIFREIDNGGFDSLVSAFYEESVHPQTKEHFYIVRGDAQNGGIDSTFVHGKVHRRQYLIDKNIRWNKDLTIHEDSYFNCLCQKCTSPDRVKYCPQPFYLWKWRDESVCRRDPKYILKTMPNMLKSNTALVEQFITRGMVNEARYYSTAMIFDSYYQINCKQWMENENKEFKDTLELCFKEYFEKFEYLYKEIDQQVRLQIIAGIRNRFFQEGLDLESITFDDWIKHIKEL